MTPLQSLVPLPRPVAGKISVRETRCSTLLHRLAYGASTGYTANLYRGCTHGCVYCYAPSLTHDERGWGSYVDVKVNAPDVMERELKGLRRDQVFLSSASDPYQPVEAKYRVTRRCLELLRRSRFPVSILTRSPLILRDLELLKRLEWVRVGMSITTVPVREFEPGVPPLRRRIATLKEIASAGIRTWVSLAPVIPGAIKVDLEGLFKDISDAGVSSVSFGVLRFTGYEESKKMFEEAAGMSTADALVGRDGVVAELSDLVRRYGMDPSDDARWKPGPNFATSLDGFAGPPLAGAGMGPRLSPDSDAGAPAQTASALPQVGTGTGASCH
jgi:DNA repair photolyase